MTEHAGSLADITIAVVGNRYYHAKRGAIFSGRDAAGNICIVRAPGIKHAIRRQPARGEIWHVTGTWEAHPEHGLQVDADTCDLVKPFHGKLLVRYLRDTFDQIGKERARALYMHFDARGEDLVEILDNRQIVRLTEVLPVSVAESLADAWRERMLETRVILELDRLGFSTRQAHLLLSVWGDLALEVLRDNPYFMLAFMEWETVDRIALRLGIGRKADIRLVGAVEAALYLRLDQKHTLTRHARLRKTVMHLLGPGCGTETAERAIHLALDFQSAVGDHRAGYRTRIVAHMEEYLKQRIPQMIEGEAEQQRKLLDAGGQPKEDIWEKLFTRYGKLSDLTEQGAQCLQDVFEEYASETGETLNKEQRRALSMVLESPFCLLTGGAGTGKTAIIRALHMLARRTGFTIHQMALSNMAKERIKTATGEKAFTVAKFIRMVMDGRISLEDEPLIIIDEASMIGLSTLYTIIRHMPKGARLLLVGDPGQLPPIEFGLTFHILAASDRVPRTELKETHRQAMETHIPAIAAQIRNHVLPEIGRYEGDKQGVSFVPCHPGDIVRKLFEISQELGGPEQSQIIGAIKSGRAGTHETNLKFHEWLAAGKPAIPDEPYCTGDPVIYLENDEARDLYNGTLGKVTAVRCDQAEPAIECRFGNKVHLIGVDEFYKMSLAYAITCHKAQGSQFPRVIIPIMKSRLLDNILIYTAMTRAKWQVVFVGDKNLFDAAVVASPRSLLRRTGFEI